MSDVAEADISDLERGILAAVEAAKDEPALEAVRVGALGRKGSVSERLKGLGAMSPEARKVMGPALNGLRDRIGEAIAARRAALKAEALRARLASEAVDVSLPVRPSALELGRIH